MTTEERRIKIIALLNEAENAVSASALAKILLVSRQVIVGDIALLRAQGQEILSTPRGYIIDTALQTNGVIFKIACSHSKELAGDELYAIVDNGGKVLDVVVEHPMYGQLTGQLNIRSRYDVDLFLEKVEAGQVSLLSNLTDGVHLHTVSCSDETTKDRIKSVLSRMNILLSEK